MEKFAENKLNIADYEAFERAYQTLNITAKLKTLAEDFMVEENIAVDFSGEGEHCWLYIKKQHCNTDWLAQQLAQFCEVKKMAVAYAGLKDRHAVTSQWFSIHLPGLPTPDWHEFETRFNHRAATETGPRESIRILHSVRHNRKLQRGALKSNTFNITLRELSDTGDSAFGMLEQRCAQIAAHGVPNYFGAQRFGRNGSNLEQAAKLFARPRSRLSRHKRSLYLSAARSWLFNCILSERVGRQVWNTRISGDVFMLNGRSACFRDAADDDDRHAIAQRPIDQRLLRHEIHPTAVLWGKGDPMVTAEAASLEAGIIDRYPDFRDGLLRAGVQLQRRACRVIPEDMHWQRERDNFMVAFRLPAGSYATGVLAEIFCHLKSGSDDNQ
jgi:tRNA pseudouridine13 synthase